MKAEEFVSSLLEEVNEKYEKFSDVKKNGIVETSYEIPKFLYYLVMKRASLVKALNAATRKKREIYLSLWKYYMGLNSDIDRKPCPYRIMKGDVKTFIEADGDFIAIDKIVRDIESAISILEEYIQSVKQMQYLLKLIQDNKKLEGI